VVYVWEGRLNLYELLFYCRGHEVNIPMNI